MKNFNVLIMAALLLTIINGCQKDDPVISQLADGEQPQIVVKPDVYVENGYLVFNSNTRFTKELDALKNGDKTTWEQISSKTNFITLNDFNKQKLLLKSGIMDNENSDEPESDDEIVEDPYLQKFLNQNREIVIGDKLYKITNIGMFRCDPEKLETLNLFIESNPKFNGLVNDGSIDQFVEVGDGIELFLPKEIYPISNSSESGNGRLKSGNIDYAIMNECDEDSKTWAGEVIGGILGYSVNCENNFSSNKRVKTVFWAQN